MRYLFLLVAFLLSNGLKAQLLTDEPTKQQIVRGLDKLYNFEFDEAEAILAPVQKAYATHPVSDLLTAFTLQFKNLPIEKSVSGFASYTAALQRCQRKAEALINKPEYKPEATFFLLASHGYLALSANYRKDYMKAVNDARQAYSYLKDGFKFMAKNNEFYYTTGMYNYYRVQYPLTHPVVKPLMIFFEDGNKNLGKQQMVIAATRSVFSRTEAATVLTHVYLKYEKDFANGLKYAALLGKKYPNNPIFKLRYAEALLLNGQFEAAQPHITALKRYSNSIFALSANFFAGYEAEMHDKNDQAAAQAYTQALKYTPDSRYTEDYYAMAYLGMGRIMQRNGDKDKAAYYFRKCLDTAQYSWVRAEAKQRLSAL